MKSVPDDVSELVLAGVSVGPPLKGVVSISVFIAEFTGGFEFETLYYHLVATLEGFGDFARSCEASGDFLP